MIQQARKLIAMELIPFPKTSLQAYIPSELHMPREIPRDQVTLELLQTLLGEAGYESSLEGEAIYIHRSGCGLRMRLEPEYSFLRINALYMLNPSLTEESLNALLVNLNEEYQIVKLSAFRWDDGDLGLWAAHQVYFPFGLHLPNMFFVLRKVNEAMAILYQHHLRDTPFLPPASTEEADEETSPQLSLVEDVTCD